MTAQSISTLPNSARTGPQQSVASTHGANTFRAIQTDEEKAQEDLTVNSPLKSEALKLRERKSSQREIPQRQKRRGVTSDKRIPESRPSQLIVCADFADVQQSSYEEDEEPQKMIKVK